MLVWNVSVKICIGLSGFLLSKEAFPQKYLTQIWMLCSLSTHRELHCFSFVFGLEVSQPDGKQHCSFLRATEFLINTNYYDIKGTYSILYILHGCTCVLEITIGKCAAKSRCCPSHVVHTLCFTDVGLWGVMKHYETTHNSLRQTTDRNFP